VTIHQATMSIVESELRAAGIDHAEAGALVAAKWNLSPNIQELIKHHHDATESEALKLPLAVLRTADALAHERGAGWRWPGCKGSSPDARVVRIAPSRVPRASRV
jgi:HD-like signal output (HDOD) protein